MSESCSNKLVDFINRLIKFPKVNIEVKPIYILYKTELSQILLCEETKTKTKFCIKVILSEKNDQGQLNMIRTEIYLLQKLKNERNIVQMYDYISFEMNNYIYYLILMEYCQYHTLLEYIDKNQILDDARIYSIIFQIAVGLKALHKNNYYHRDLRPENILLRNQTDKDIEIVLCDFGSATNKIYPNEKLKNMHNTNSMTELLFDLCSKTNIIYRAPEEIIINSNQPITEKVDIFSLGVISVMLLLSYIPPPYFNFQLLLHSSKDIRVKIITEIYNSYDRCFSELLDSVFSTNTTERFTIDEVINFLMLNQNRIKAKKPDFKSKKEKILFMKNYHKTLYEFEEQAMNENQFSIKVLTRRILHGKFLSKEGIFEAPDCSYINRIINLIRQEHNKIIEFYSNLFSTNVFFYNIFSLKFAFDLHYFIFNFNQDFNKFPNNIEILCPKELDVFAQLDDLNNFLKIKINKKYHSKEEILRDINITKIITQYIQFIKKKILLLKNYPLLISNDNTINAKNYKSHISQNFIFDIWYLFYLSYQILSSIPYDNKTISQILDLISYILNQEIVSLCSILFIQLIFLKKKNQNFDFFSKFIEIVEKSSKFLKDLEKYKKEINSKYEVIYLLKSENKDKKLRALLNLINDIKYDKNFDETEFFKSDSSLRKKLDFIPIKIYFFDKNNLSNNDKETTELNKDISNLVIDSEKQNYNEFNDSININLFKKNDQNDKINIDLNNKESQNQISENINNFLNSVFSMPLYHFVIQHEYLKIYNYNLIGKGATSEVYFGNYKGLDVAIKKIKIKQINDNFYKEYQNEISILTSIRHPNIVMLLGTMVEDNNLCIVTEYCEGGTLYDLLYKKKNIEIPLNLKLNILIQISKALNFLHQNEPPIIHRDLKSLNVLLTSHILENNKNEHISIKISDFGLSQIIYQNSKNINLTGVGSVQWMAPETLQSNTLNNIDEKVDVFSFGIIIWEIYSRTQPYKDMTTSQIINYVCNEGGRPDCDLIIKDEMPKGLFELMKKCWDTDPNLRPDFQKILEILNDLKSLGE